MYQSYSAISNLKYLLVVLTLSITSSVLATPNDAYTIRPGTVIYKKMTNASVGELKGLNALLSSQGLLTEKTLTGSQITIATFQHKGRETAIANILKHSGYVEFAEPDYAVPPTLQPSDPNFGNQWHHNNVNSQQAWDITTGSNSVLVAVCDTGFDVNHPDLGPNLRIDLAYNAHDGSTNIYDAHGHGTGTAGTLGAVGNNGTGVAGVNWDVDIIPIRIAISDGNSSAYISTMATCIEYAADNGARVVNLSYGGIQYATIDSAAQYLRARNGLLFMSAGNDYDEFSSYPDYTSFIGVGATDQNDNKANFSNWGTFVDITAPGVSILTTYPNNRYVYYSGTSFSSPLAAGIAALMVAANPSITINELENGMFSTAVDIGDSGDDNVFGHGLVDAQAAVNYALNLSSFIAPVADIDTSSNSVLYGSSVTLSAINSYDPDGFIVSYQWNLGDGTISNQPETNHTYGAAGSYQVSLTITDNDDLSDTATTVIQVTNEVPVAVIDEMANSHDIGVSITFNGSYSYDNDGSISNYTWDFGNGEMHTGETVEYTYPTGGDYTVTLTVTDNAGAMNSATVNISIVDPFILAAPSALLAQVEGMDVLLNWQDNSSSETSFIVERGVKFRGRTQFEMIATLNADTTTHTDTVPETGQYSFRVKAVNLVNEATSETVKVTVDSTTSEPEPKPGTMIAPTNLVAMLNGNIVELSWLDNSSDELGFHIERGIKRKGTTEFSLVAIIGGNITSFPDNISGLSTGNYVYRVRAYKDDEMSDFSNTAALRLK